MFQLLIPLLTSCSPSPALACTCIPGPKPRTSAEARAAIAAKNVLFAGQVVATSSRRDSTRVLDVQKGDSIWFRYTSLLATVIPLRVWKGTVQDTVQVETDAYTTMCGASLRTGEQYLIDADSIDGSASLWTDKCRWTRPLSETDELVKILKRLGSS
jgi:hypothetical protein